MLVQQHRPGCVCYQRRPHSQTHGLKRWAKDWHLKIAKASPQTHLWLKYAVTGKEHRNAYKGIKTLTHSWARYGNAIHRTVSALVPNRVWAWPLTLLAYWSPAGSEDRRGPICIVSARYAFIITTQDILLPLIYVSRLNPAPHRETASVRCLHKKKPGCIRQTASRELCSQNTVDVWQVWAKWRKNSFCR